VNSDTNIKRKEMKNNYSPRHDKYIFRSLLHALHTELVKRIRDSEPKEY